MATGKRRPYGNARKGTKDAKASGTAGAAGQRELTATGTPQQLAQTESEKPPDYAVPGPEGLSRELADKLIAARQTMPRRFAAKHCGVSPRTFERFLQVGSSSDHDPICVYFTRRINEVEGGDVGDTIGGLQLLRKVSPQAADLYLKLMHPEDFGGHVRTVPDEFDGQERNRQAQDKFLAAPPPRMLAKMREHRWVQIPEGATPEETALIESMLHNIRARVTQDAATAMLPAERE